VTASEQQASESGALGAGGVTEVLQGLEKRQSSGVVRFSTPAGDAEVELLSGMIVDARMEELSGRGALFRLLGLTDGSFEFKNETGEPRPALTPSLERLLNELSQWHKLSEQAPALSSVPELSEAGREALERHGLAEEQRMLLELADGQRALAEIIDESGVDAVDALTLLVGAVQGGLLTIRSVQASLYPLKAEFGVVSPILSISRNPNSTREPQPAAGPPSQPPLSTAYSPIAYIPVTRKTLVTGGPLPQVENRPAPGVHRIITIDSPVPPPPSNPRSAPAVFASVDRGDAPNTARFASGVEPDLAHGPENESGPRRSSPYPHPPSSAGELLAAPVREVVIAPNANARYIGRYQVLCRIGRGGMGSVYLCRLSSQGGFRRLFALKLLRKHLMADSAAAQRFLDEARLSGHIHHPNVVSVVDAGFHASQPYLVMDYVEGGSLKELLAAHESSRPPQLVLSIILDALAGLHSAHTLVGDDGRPLQIVHCDVSPENLLVGTDGVCRLTDFGVARQGEALQGPSQVTHGKPGYLAPEQIVGGRVDCRADVFAMGVVLYQALTGTKLFEANTVEDTLHAVRTRRIDPPSTVGLGPPPSLDFVCMRALERDPERRFASAQEMMMELRRIALRENLLSPTSEVAAWVRESVGHDLARRRLIVLEASQRSRPTMDVMMPQPPATHPSSRPPPDHRAESSDAPPSSSLPAPPSGQESQTIALDPSVLTPGGGPSISGPTRWALILASVLAVAVVLAAVLWPALVSKMFRLRTDGVNDETALPSRVEAVPAPPPTGSSR
jgi:serine/threonine protein kinase